MHLNLVPITLKGANAFVKALHRHHGPTQGGRFSIGCATSDGILRGVAIVGRPTSRMSDDGQTAEVTRLCTDSTPHVASKLYAAAWRAAQTMGYTHILTYILEEELGTSLRAAGWEEDPEPKGGGSWSRLNRPRDDKHPLGPKRLFFRKTAPITLPETAKLHPQPSLFQP